MGDLSSLIYAHRLLGPWIFLASSSYICLIPFLDSDSHSAFRGILLQVQKCSISLHNSVTFTLNEKHNSLEDLDPKE